MFEESSETTISFFKPAIATAATCLVLAALAFTSDVLTTESQTLRTSNFGSVSNGEAPPSGCAILYAADYHRFPGTKRTELCFQSSAAVVKYNLDKTGFDNFNEASGPSYITTAPDTFLAIYTDYDFKGEVSFVPPGISLNLRDVPLRSKRLPNVDSFNDHVRSIAVFLKAPAVGTTIDADAAPKDNCAIIYGTDPSTTNSPKGIQICPPPVDLTKTRLFTFDYEDQVNQNFDLLSLSAGISFIKVGKGVSLRAFITRKAEGKYYTDFAEGEKADLTKVKIGGYGTDRVMNDLVRSFVLILNENTN